MQYCSTQSVIHAIPKILVHTYCILWKLNTFSFKQKQLFFTGCWSCLGFLLGKYQSQTLFFTGLDPFSLFLSTPHLFSASAWMSLGHWHSSSLPLVPFLLFHTTPHLVLVTDTGKGLVRYWHSSPSPQTRPPDFAGHCKAVIFHNILKSALDAEKYTFTSRNFQP